MLMPELYLIQPIHQISNQIIAGFQPYRQSQQAGGDAGFQTNFLGQTGVGGGARMGDQGLGIAQIVGNQDNRQAVRQGEGRFLAALELDGQQCRAALPASRR